MTKIQAYMLMAAVAAVAVPMTVRAQDNSPTADQLVARAQALHESPSEWAVAASLYKKSASLRAPGDPKAIEALAMAGRLYTYAGESGRGYKAMEAAAEQALGTGDVLTAAHLFAEAAFIAGNYDHNMRSADLVERVVWLAAAPGLTGDQRSEVLGRLGSTITVAAAAAGTIATSR